MADFITLKLSATLPPGTSPTNGRGWRFRRPGHPLSCLGEMASIRVLAGLIPALLFGVPGCSATPSPEASEPSVSRPNAQPHRESTPSVDGPLVIGGADLTVVVDGGPLPIERAAVDEWIRNSAEEVSAYFGRFPVPSLKITVSPTGRRAIGFGQHWDGRYLKIRLGSRVTARDLERDWVMTHEMLHAAFPDLERRHKWMQEGLSTYLQRVIQTRSGKQSEAALWKGCVRQMPHGRPRAGDDGLDNTRSWGSLYWGGALYWMMADVEIRKATKGRKSLQDALVGILEKGGSGRANWTTARVVKVGDEATGTTVLTDLYRDMATRRGDVDLEQLWEQLGVVEEADGTVSFDETAQLAEIRRAISAPF